MSYSLKKLYAVTRRKLRVLALTVLMLAVLAFAVFHKATATVTPTPPAPPGVPPLATGEYLAVVPFALEGDPTTLQPVAEGLSERLSAKLLALRDVTVASARATEDVDPHANLAAIGGYTGVNLVIRGSLQGDKKTIQVNVRLEEVTSGKRRLDQKFSELRSDLMKVEDQIYAQVLQVLDLSPTDKETSRAAPLPRKTLRPMNSRSTLLPPPVVSPIKMMSYAIQAEPKRPWREMLLMAALILWALVLIGKRL